MRRFAVSVAFVCAFGVLSPAFAQIQNLQNTNNTLDVVSPNGPSTILNLKIPLSLIGATNDPILGGVNNSPNADATGVFGLIRQLSPGANSAGVRGVNNGTGPAGIGVWGEQHGSGFGVFGQSQKGIGVHGVGQDAFGTGVDGRHLSSAGTAPGVRGLSNSRDEGAHAVLGEMSSGASPTSAGVRGLNARGFGVFGRGGSIGVVGMVERPRTRPGAHRLPEIKGVYGSARGRGAHGVVGEAHSETGEVFGVWGISHSASGVGVKGALARLHPIEVEQDKPREARGRYLVPEAFGRPATEGVYYQAPANLEEKESPQEDEERRE